MAAKTEGLGGGNEVDTIPVLLKSVSAMLDEAGSMVDIPVSTVDRLRVAGFESVWTATLWEDEDTITLPDDWTVTDATPVSA